ncbi:MAG: glycerate kinase [Candidatus Stahlbacteria bacterium]|nr:glycerate kinase [Candidatus Stahlbacteria bacterium]
MGVKFTNKEGKCFIPVGGTLKLINNVEIPCNLHIPEIIVLCDVNNPLLGDNGAAKRYAPQKGASKKEVKLLEQGLTHLANLTDSKIAQKSGMGAGGGVPFGLSLIGAKEVQPQIVMGTKFIMELVEFEKRARNTNLIITGEGEISESTKYGKVCWEVMRFGKIHKIPVIAITGRINKINSRYFCEHGLTEIFCLSNNRMTQAYSISHTAELLQSTAEKIGQLLKKY